MTSALATLPDVTGALRAFLRAQPAITALVDDRIWIGWPRDPNGSLRVKVPPFMYAILLESGRGGLPPEQETPYGYERFDISYLGPNEHDANLLYRTVHPYLMNATRSAPQGFRAANTLVSGVYAEGGPIRAVDPATNWPRTQASYQVRYCSVPASQLGPSALVTPPMRWRGRWSPGSYARGDVVRDGSWTMACINPAGTTDRPAPQTGPSSGWLLPDDPVWDTVTDTWSTAAGGTRISAPRAGYLLNVRYWDYPGANPNISYSVAVRLDPGLLSERIIYLAEDVDDDPSSGGWITLRPASPILILSEQTFDLLLSIYNRQAAPAATNLSYYYSTPQGSAAPKAGELVHANSATTRLRVHKTGQGGAANATFLAGVVAGWQIAAAGVTWTVQAAADLGDYLEYTVSPNQQGSPDGITLVSFSEFAPTSIDYVRLSNYWVDYPHVTGFLETLAAALFSSNEHAYGIDVETAEALVSPDWDIVAVSGTVA